MLEFYETMSMREIAENHLSVTSQHLRVLVQREQFPRASFKTPGLKGKFCWFSSAVELYLAEYHALQDEGLSRADAARRATRVASNHSDDLKSVLIAKRARGVKRREKKTCLICD